MIDTAKYEIAKGAVEQTLGHAKEQAQETLGDLSGRVMEADVVQQLRKRTRRELKHAQHELKKAAKHAQKVKPSGRSKSRRSTKVFVVVAIVGGVAAAAYFVQRRRAATPSATDVAPDPFGAAVREEEKAGAFQRPYATPGA